MKNNQVQKMVAVSMFAAIGLVLQYIAFPIMPAFGFLKIDFSDIPIMISMFLFGPMAGIATAFIRSVLHLITTGFSPSNMVGDVASFFASTIFTLPMYYFFNKGSHKFKNKAVGTVSGILALTVFMSVANYFVITPLYLYFFGVNANQFLGMPLINYVLIGIVPFNLIKGAIVSAVFLVLHAKLLPWLVKKQHQFNRPSTIIK
ncbi:ECF transporter S component [Enterococcus sp. JM4C]|uniref:ECF transporter S component n=1 Tax=Candidatus Enterococcus huntleyi TaxID=1857217 RepID=UPI00137A2CF9|nr:ECF transporter S component [Enterococcus sp. JM4C]KAF1298095.1 ECF transporter S component [Enterococcus sp. JM4C]